VERAGYVIEPFVRDFLATPAGSVPRVATGLTARDRLGTALVRSGFRREGYVVAPGLYAVGLPGVQSPVLVTANYKLSFDALRAELAGVDAWMLVVDTRGVNVWCAAGKGLFSAEEIARQVKRARLNQVVGHRRLVLPQLCAPGVAAWKLRKLCGFSAEFGPVRAADVADYLRSGEAMPAMREASFDFMERLVLVPVELTLLWRPALAMLVAVLALSGLGPGVFSFSAMLARAPGMLAALAAGVIAGCVAMPLLLPRLPGTMFAVKGLWPGLALGLAVLAIWGPGAGIPGSLAMLLACLAVASYGAMNFTGSTPYTSPSGVEKEMRRVLPLQAGAGLASVILWIVAGFSGGAS